VSVAGSGADSGGGGLLQVVQEGGGGRGLSAQGVVHGVNRYARPNRSRDQPERAEQSQHQGAAQTADRNGLIIRLALPCACAC
jgi:hypothetical protein